MSTTTTLPAAPAPSTWTFTQGFILGQASFLLIVLLFIRYVVFSPAESTDEEGWKERRAERAKRSKLSTTGVPPPPPSQILGKTGYDMSTHPAESTDWLNTLFAQILQGYRNDLLSEGGEEGARQRIEKWLNPDSGSLSWLDPIQVTALSLGNAYPLLSNARIRPADGSGHIRAEIDLDYVDALSLSLSTSVLINFPRPRFAVLPVALGVELVSIGGTLSIEIHDPRRERQHLHACLLPDFHLNLKTTTLLGSRAKLQDVPKLEQLIVSRLRSALQDKLVHPHHLSLALPRLLSPSVSPTPLINDLGEGAVDAMNDALRNGVSTMVDDFVGSPRLAERSIPSTAPPSIPETEPSPTRVRRKIVMPAGFPGYTPSEGNTPLATPQSRQTLHRSNPSLGAGDYISHGQGMNRTQPGSLPPGSVAASSARLQPGQGSMAGSSQSQFRFRGQFASQPGTPGLGGAAPEARRVGALNAR